MIGPTGTIRVMVATRPVDFRKGADGLAALVRDTMATDPFGGTVFVFRAKRAQRPTFRIRFPLLDDRVPVASACGAPGAGCSVSSGQGAEVHLHR